jgi:hypothetical protein
MEKYTTKPFTEALGALMRERYGDKLGRFSIGKLTSHAAEKLDLSEEYVRLIVREERPLRIDVVEAAAEFLDMDAHYFIEYRNWWVKSMMERYPSMSEKVYELVRSLFDAVEPNWANK